MRLWQSFPAYSHGSSLITRIRPHLLSPVTCPKFSSRRVVRPLPWRSRIITLATQMFGQAGQIRPFRQGSTTCPLWYYYLQGLSPSRYTPPLAIFVKDLGSRNPDWSLPSCLSLFSFSLPALLPRLHFSPSPSVPSSFFSTLFLLFSSPSSLCSLGLTLLLASSSSHLTYFFSTRLCSALGEPSVHSSGICWTKGFFKR